MRRMTVIFATALLLCSCNSDPKSHAPEPPRPLPHDVKIEPPAWTHCVDHRDPAGCMGRVPPQH